MNEDPKDMPADLTEAEFDAGVAAQAATGVAGDDIAYATEQATPGVEAPKVTRDLIESKIVTVLYTRASERMTICLLTLANGFEVMGESSCVSAENYNQEIGEKIAYENALNKIWVLEGYLLRESLYVAQLMNAEGAFIEAFNRRTEAVKAPTNIPEGVEAIETSTIIHDEPAPNQTNN